MHQSKEIKQMEKNNLEEDAIEMQIQTKDFVQGEKVDWDLVLVEDYSDVLDYKNMIERVVYERILSIYDLENKNWIPKLVSIRMVPMADGSVRELYLLWHYQENDENSMTYSGILVDYATASSKLLFQTDTLYDSSYESFYEFYDIQICDVDGNEEEDIILLLGTHTNAGAEAYLPNLYCMIGLQKNGEFQFVTDRNEKWLDTIVRKLYTEDQVNWKILNILESLKAHYGNEDIIKITQNSQDIEDYINLKDQIILDKLDNRSLYFDRELLWEKVIENDEKDIQKLKVYKEFGEQGCSAKVRISVYLFDYATEDVELQVVPDIYEEISEKYSNENSGYLANLELDEILYKDVNDDGMEDIQMIVNCIIKKNEYEKIEEKYEIVYFQGENNNKMKLFDEVVFRYESDS